MRIPPDNNGNLLTKVVTGKGTTSAGQQSATFTYVYDALNRVTSKAPQGQPTVNYTYDLAGRPASTYFSNGSVTLSYKYDTAGRLTASTSQVAGATQPKQISYGWDGNGNRTQMTWPDGHYAVAYDYDELNRLLRIREVSPGVTAATLATFTYDSLSHRTGMILGDGSSATYGYDPSTADLINIGHQFTSGSAFSYAYNSTATHQRRYANVTDGGGNSALVWSHPALGTTTYASYVPTGGATNYDQIVSLATTPPGANPVTTTTMIAYDGRGNVTCTGTISVLQPCVGNSYTFDSENHLMAAVSSGFNASYAYDPLGRRQSKNVNGNITQFVVSSLRHGEPATRYQYDGLNRISQVTAPNDTNGYITAYSYNFRNQQLTVSNQASASSAAVTLQTNSYNSDGVLQTVADGESGSDANQRR